MKNIKSPFLLKVKLKIFLSSLFILIFSLTVTAQVPRPSEESFTPAFGRIGDATNSQNRRETDTVKIYNADGTIWYEFSYYKNSPLFHKTHTKSDFKPIVPYASFQMELPLKAESENWYEVVVNEETRLTKYTWKNDSVLGRNTWESFIPQSVYVKFDREKNPLRESPNGELSKEELPTEQKYFMPGNIQGEWLQIGTGWTIYVNKPIGGWIRWKDGNKLLIGFWDYENEKSNPMQ